MRHEAQEFRGRLERNGAEVFVRRAVTVGYVRIGFPDEHLQRGQVDHLSKHLRVLPLCSLRSLQGFKGLGIRDSKSSRGTARLSDFLFLSFVFIDILALFRRIRVKQLRVES
jgi:hypothetical protein